MKKPTHQLGSSATSSHRKRWLTAGALIVIVAGSVAGFMYLRPNDSKAKDEAQTSSAKKDLDDKTDDNEDAGLPDDSTNLTTDQVPSSPTTSVTITNVSQSDGSVNASASATGATEGTCVFTFSHSEERPVTRQVTTTNGSCSTAIPAVEFSRLGQWDVSVLFYSNGVKTEGNSSVTIS